MLRLTRTFTLEMGRLLRQLRRRSGLTQWEVARRIGWRNPAGRIRICLLERGKRPRPSVSLLIRYLQACGVQQEEFWGAFDAIPDNDAPDRNKRRSSTIRKRKAGPLRQGSPQTAI